MTTPAWQAPEPEAGPGPGMALRDRPGSRLVAYILDVVIQFLIILVLGDRWPIVLGALIFFPLGVHLGARDHRRRRSATSRISGRAAGQTPGMNVMKIKVVRELTAAR